MNPARWPRRMPPRPPFEARYPASTRQPPGAATRNNLPVNRGPQPSTDKSRASSVGVFGFRLILILIHTHGQFPPPRAIRLPNLHLIFPNLLIPQDIS